MVGDICRRGRNNSCAIMRSLMMTHFSRSHLIWNDLMKITATFRCAACNGLSNWASHHFHIIIFFLVRFQFRLMWNRWIGTTCNHIQLKWKHCLFQFVPIHSIKSIYYIRNGIYLAISSWNHFTGAKRMIFEYETSFTRAGVTNSVIF